MRKSGPGLADEERAGGMGLACVASVVKAHKGTIHAESDFGQGTRFIISIPLLEE